jgi:hypothetical protein
LGRREVGRRERREGKGRRERVQGVEEGRKRVGEGRRERREEGGGKTTNPLIFLRSKCKQRPFPLLLSLLEPLDPQSRSSWVCLPSPPPFSFSFPFSPFPFPFPFPFTHPPLPANHTDLERVYKAITSKNISIEVFTPILVIIEPRLQELFANFQYQKRAKDRNIPTGKKKGINKIWKGFSGK